MFRANPCDYRVDEVSANDGKNPHFAFESELDALNLLLWLTEQERLGFVKILEDNPLHPWAGDVVRKCNECQDRTNDRISELLDPESLHA